MKLLRQLRSRFRKEKLDAEMAEEMRHHLDAQMRRNLAAGMSPEDAHYAARRSFGGVEQIKERARDGRGWIWLEQTQQDLRYAFRQIARAPGFTAIAVLSLALGIGANTALFSLVDEVLLRSLPVKNPSELVLLRWLSGPNQLARSVDGSIKPDPATGLRTSTSLSYFIFDRLRGQTEVFSDLFAFAEQQQLNISVDHQAEIAGGQLVTGGYFAGLGVPALRGRMLTADDDRVGAAPAVVVSHRFWQQRLGGADAAIGRTILVNNVAFTVVGVMPRDFHGALQIGSEPDVTLPLAFDPQGRANAASAHSWWLHIIGRLQPGVTAEQAQARVEPAFVQAASDAWLSRAFSGATPTLAGRDLPKLRLEPGGRGLTEVRRSNAQPLRILMVIVGAVLLIACLNVASLLLARSTTRAREIAVRLSVGASRARIIRQLLTESLLLSVLGGAFGVMLAYWGRDALVRVRSYGGSGTLDLNWHVLAFTVGVSLVTGLLFGLAPAWRATRIDLNTALKGNTAGSTGSARFGLRRSLMVAQLALSVVLLVGAGLFLRTLHNLRTLDTGFNRTNLVLFRVDAALSGYRGAQISGLFDRLLERLAVLPGVQGATLSRHPLLSGSRRVSTFSLENASAGESRELSAAVNLVAPNFLPTLGIPLLLGRNLTAGDREGAPLVAVVNETFVRKYFPGQNPLGRAFSLRGTFDPKTRVEIVGVARDAHYAELREAVPPTIYVPYYQDLPGQVNFTIRTAGDPATLVATIRAAVHETDPNVPLFELRTQEEQIGQLVSEERLFAMLSAFFGAVALALTAIGLYGLLAQQVAARTREIGIRMALGAQARAVVALVLGEGLWLSLLGVGLGLAAALGLTRFVTRFLYDVQPADPLALAGAGALLFVVGALACLVPTRRAVKVDPMVALRAE